MSKHHQQDEKLKSGLISLTCRDLVKTDEHDDRKICRRHNRKFTKEMASKNTKKMKP